MSWNIFLFECKRRLSDALIFGTGIAITVVVFLSFYPILAKDRIIYQRIMTNFPEPMKRALGIMDLDITTLTGVFSFSMTFVILVAAVHACKLGIGIIGEEFRIHTADFLMTKPVKRHSIIHSKWLAALLMILMIDLLTGVLSVAIVQWAYPGEMELSGIPYVFLGMFFIQLFFLGIGSLWASLSKRIRIVVGPGMGIPFFFYFIQVIQSSLGDEKLSYLTPFAYFKPEMVMKNTSIDLTYLGLDIVLVIVFLGLSSWLYHRRNISAL